MLRIQHRQATCGNWRIWYHRNRNKELSDVNPVPVLYAYRTTDNVFVNTGAYCPVLIKYVTTKDRDPYVFTVLSGLSCTVHASTVCQTHHNDRCDMIR